MGTPPIEDASHVRDDELAAYLDRRLPSEDRDRLEVHFAECAPCRGDLLGAQALLAQVAPPRRAWRVGGALAAAAALLLVVTQALDRAPPDADDRVVRSAAERAMLVAYGPLGEARAATLRFVWSAAPGALSYRLTVTRADGAAVWTQGGIDTVIVLPDSVTIVPGRGHRWVVDALLSDGSTRTTGLHEFELGR